MVRNFSRRDTLCCVEDRRGADYQPGERVRVRRDEQYGPGPWPAEPNGTVGWHPGSLDANPWVPVDTQSGPRRSYWIVFDDPQFDADGDGPYSEAEVLDSYLESTSSS